MYKKRIVFLSFVSCLFLSSCGSDSGLSGGATELSTVYLTASTTTLDIDSDVAKLIKTDLACGPGNISIPPADSSSVVITSNIYPKSSSGVPSSPVEIISETVKFTPVRNPNTGIIGPSLGDEVHPLNVTIVPGGSVTVPIRVGLQETKEFLLGALACGGQIYLYHATIVLDAVEKFTNEHSTIVVSTNVRFADFADK